VILYKDREAFDKSTTLFKTVIKQYQAALRGKLAESKAGFEKRIIDEFTPRWVSNPPGFFNRWGSDPTKENVRGELQRLAHEIFEGAISFDEPKVKVLYKNVAPENIHDPAFLGVLKKHMNRRRVPKAVIDSLFESGQAAPESGAFRRASTI
jgi:hypothetical protein